MHRMRHTHYITAFKNAQKYLLFLLIPVIRGLISARRGFWAWLDGAWIDLWIIAGVVVLSLLRWRLFRYQMHGEYVHIQKGLFFRQDLYFPIRSISTYSVERPLFYKPFGAVRVYIDTDGGSSSRPDITMSLRRQDAELLKKHIYKKFQVSGPHGTLIKKYKCKTRYIILLSAVLSNTVVSIVFAAIFINRLGDIIGTEIQSRLVGTLTQFAEALFLGISPTAALIGYVLLGGWFIGALTNIVRMLHFTVKRFSNAFVISRGIFTNREYIVNYEKINYITVRQSVLTKIFRLYSVFIQTAGYSNASVNSPKLDVLIPAIPKRHFALTTRMLLGGVEMLVRQIRPAGSSFLRYLGFPLALGGFDLLGWLAGIYLLPTWSALISFVFLMGGIICLWFFILRLLTFCSAGVGAKDNMLMLCYSRKLKINRVYLMNHKTVLIRLRQSVFQKRKRLCDLYVYNYGATKSVHRVKALRVEETERLLRLTHFDWEWENSAP